MKKFILVNCLSLCILGFCEAFSGALDGKSVQAGLTQDSNGKWVPSVTISTK